MFNWTCGVKTIAVPCAEKHSRCTLLFEAFAIDVLQASQSIQSAALLLGVARMLKNRLDRILTWFSSPISNGTSEDFNSRIQAIKSAARGFRSFEDNRIRILFYCGNLSLKP